MNCQDVRQLLHPYVDGELDLVRQLEIEAHVAHCANCAEQENRLRMLRAAVASPSLYYRAPDTLRERIRLSALPIRSKSRPLAFQRMGIAAALLLMMGAGTMIFWLTTSQGVSTDDRLADWVVASHVRSLQLDHLMDVASTDRHTVKPWFLGKVDFSPQVVDLSEHGYRLAGGRLDYLADRTVAALVYYRRDHAINVLIWPAANDEPNAARALTRQGFHLRRWQQSEMTYWAISDLNDHELDTFVRLLQESSTVPRR